jgi:SAM-dependent methyltransferase
MKRLLSAWQRREAPPGDWFALDDIAEICAVYERHGSVAGSPWDRYRDAHMRLPEWFRAGLDPWSAEYADQQQRLWRAVVDVDRNYDPALDEQEIGWEGVDPVRRPGFWGRRDPLAVHDAAHHVLATGMLLQHSRLRPGDWALEYGPGFGQSALALARLGVNVDVVDISEAFCGFVRAQAEFFDVPLHAHRGCFGERPQADRRYKLIWFYESFHHCVDFMTVVKQLPELLQDGGQIVLQGEPIVDREYAAVPYPWGVRLHSEVAAVMRRTRWFELGFSRDFLFELFARQGLVGRVVECEPSLFGRMFVFEKG